MRSLASRVGGPRHGPGDRDALQALRSPSSRRTGCPVADRAVHMTAARAPRGSWQLQPPARSVVLLPGLGNNSADYARLASKLSASGLHVSLAAVSRADWLRNAAGLRDVAYWQGTLKPRPTVDWYLQRVQQAVDEAQAATNGAPITLLAHSAGGWLGRLFLLEFGACSSIDRFVSLGSPHLPPPPGVIDQTRGILSFIDSACPGCFQSGVAYVTVAGKFIKGAPLAGPGSWQQRLVGAAYKQVCGQAEVWGDGIVPVPSAHLEGAVNLTLEGVYHSPLGSVDAVDTGAAGAATGLWPGGDPAQAQAAARLWYGSAGYYDLWSPYLMPDVNRR